MFQALYRLFAFGNRDYLVLHASAAITPQGSVIAFGDNTVSTRGKTSCALEIAALSHDFIVDEFVLYRISDKHIFSNIYRPIHFKGDICKYLREEHGIKVADAKFASSIDLFNIKTDVKLDAILAPYLKAEKSMLVAVPQPEKAEILKATCFSHLAKLLYPELDRSSLLTGTDSGDVKDMGDILKEFPEIELDIPVYKVYLKNLADLNELLKEQNL